MVPPDDGADRGPGPAPDRGELEALQQRVAELEARGGAPHREHHRVRATGSAVLIVRAASSTGIGGVRQAAEQIGFRAGPVEPFVRRFKHWIGIAILLIAAIIFVVWDHPTGLVVFWFAFVILAAFGIREFLAPGPGLAELRQKSPADSGGPEGTAATPTQAEGA